MVKVKNHPIQYATSLTNIQATATSEKEEIEMAEREKRGHDCDEPGWW